MSSHSVSASRPPAASPGPDRGATRTLWFLRIASAVFLLAALLQAASAGQLLEGLASGRAAHGIGALLVGVLSLVQLVAAVLVWRPGRGAGWPAVLGLVVVLGTAVQLMAGVSGMRLVHVPLGTALVALGAWLVVWSWSRHRTGAAAVAR